MLKNAIPHRAWTALCLTALSLMSAGLSACGGSSGTTTTSASALPTTSSAAKPSTNPAVAPARTTTAPAKTTTAPTSGKASSTSPSASTVKKSAARTVNSFKTALATFVDCLRKNGVNIPAAANGKSPLLSVKGLKTNTPQFRAAATKCRATLIAALQHPRLPVGAR